jgi:hypothetical protein
VSETNTTPAPAASVPAPNPRNVNLPLGGAAAMYTRENLTVLFKCSHGELGRLLARKMAPLPVRIDGQILWYIDEVQNATATVQRTLERWKVRR